METGNVTTTAVLRVWMLPNSSAPGFKACAMKVLASFDCLIIDVRRISREQSTYQ